MLAALLIGIGGGIAMSAFAGARRTASVFDRLARVTDAHDVLVLPESAEAMVALEDPATIEAIPGVAAVATAHGFFALRGDGQEIYSSLIVPVDDEATVTIGRAALRQGREPDQDRADEVLATPAAAADLGLEVGERFELLVLAELDALNSEEVLGDRSYEEVVADMQAGRLGQRWAMTLVGIGTDASQALREREGELVFTKAFHEATGAGPLYLGHMVDLEDGTTPAELQAALTSLVDGEPVSMQTLASGRETIARTLDPLATALAVFGVVLAGVTLGGWALLAARRSRALADDDAALEALGMSARGRRNIDTLRSAAVAAVATPLAIGLAVAGSTVMPLFDARRIEPHRGLDLDLFVLLVGALALAVATTALGVAMAWRRRVSRPAPAAPFAASARRSIGNPARVTALAHSFGGTGRSTTASPMLLLGGACLAGILVASIGTFDENLRHFVRTPAAYGWGYDAVVGAGNVDDSGAEDVSDMLDATLAEDEAVLGWASGVVLQGVVDGRTESLLGVGQRGGSPVGATIIAGRAPEHDDEVALGSRTAARADVSVGDEVRIGIAGADRPYRVVGTTVLPPFTSNSTDAPTLGGGAMLTRGGLDAALGLDDEEPETTLMVDLVDGADVDAFVERLREVIPDTGLTWADVYAFGPGLPQWSDSEIEPQEVQAYRTIQAMPRLLLGAVGGLAIVTLGSLLAASVRQRRREFAVLRSLGFSTGQVRRSVMWQAVTVSVIAVAVGIPFGIIAGRWIWQLSAEQLGIARDAVSALDAGHARAPGGSRRGRVAGRPDRPSCSSASTGGGAAR